MRIGIVGAGKIGGTLAGRLGALGHEVRIANSRGPETLADLAEETGATAVSAAEAAEGAELVVVTVPQGRVPDLPDDLLAGAGEDAVVVDTGNYYPQRDGRIAAIEEGVPESRWVERQLGNPVVKAFNTIYYMSLLERGREKGAQGRIALPIAGDDPAAKRVVADLMEALGFDPVDAGGLDESWRQQPGSPVYTADADEAGVRAALAEANPERPGEFRAAA